MKPSGSGRWIRILLVFKKYHVVFIHILNAFVCTPPPRALEMYCFDLCTHSYVFCMYYKYLQICTFPVEFM